MNIELNVKFNVKLIQVMIERKHTFRLPHIKFWWQTTCASKFWEIFAKRRLEPQINIIFKKKMQF